MRRPTTIETLLLSIVLLTFVCGCGGGGSGGGGSGGASTTGTMTVGLTDAPTDNVAVFDVGLVSVAFERAGGAGIVVQTLASRIDLAQLVNLTDIVGAFTLPAGVYTKATFTFNFDPPTTCHLSSASAPATLWNADGTQLSGAKEVVVNFDTGNRLIVDPGIEKLVQFDFNLNASLQINDTTNNVTVSTVLAADVDLRAPKPNRFPALLVSADAATGVIVVDIRPRNAAESKGQLSLLTVPSTVFVIDGTPRDAATGLTALAGMAGANLLVTTAFDPFTRRHTVVQVLAGRAVARDTLNVMEGFVCRRTTETSGDVTLKLRGVGIRVVVGSPSAPPAFVPAPASSVTIPVSPTAVPIISDFATRPSTAGEIDVGDRVTVLGTTYDAINRTVEGVQAVQRHRSDVLGTVRSAASFPAVEFNPLRIGPFPIRDFNPRDSGTGLTTWNPTATFIVQFPAGPTPATSDPIRAIGMFTGSSSTHPDFRAITIINRTDAVGAFVAVWKRLVAAPKCFPPGVSNAFQIGIDVGTALSVGLVDAEFEDGLIGRSERSSTQANQLYILTPGLPNAIGVFTIQDPSGLWLFRTFPAFEDALMQKALRCDYHGVLLNALGKETPAGLFAAGEIHVSFLP